jgi:hypothetical protein
MAKRGMAMPDREKVIKGLECCVKESEGYEEQCGECPYGAKGGGCIDRLLADTITMLKEQETTDIGNGRLFLCKKCGFGIEDIFVNDEEKYQLVPKYCPNCGRKVKSE